MTFDNAQTFPGIACIACDALMRQAIPRKNESLAAGGLPYAYNLACRRASAGGTTTLRHRALIEAIVMKEGNLSPEGLDALRARFQEQSRKAQAYYTVMHSMRDLAGSDDAASAWMNAPLPPFEGRTPGQLVGDGREDEVLRYIDSLRSGAQR